MDKKRIDKKRFEKRDSIKRYSIKSQSTKRESIKWISRSLCPPFLVFEYFKKVHTILLTLFRLQLCSCKKLARVRVRVNFFLEAKFPCFFTNYGATWNCRKVKMSNPWMLKLKISNLNMYCDFEMGCSQANLQSYFVNYHFST